MKAKVMLNLHFMSAVELIGYALHVVSKMTGNTYFTTPSPALSTVTSAINALQTAYDSAQGGGPAQTAMMHQKRAALELLLTALGHYVEDRANDPSNAATGAAAVILTAGINVKAITHRQKKFFSAEPDLPGTAKLYAASIVRGTHDWQYSPDISNPDAWVSVLSTSRASTIVTGLTSLKHYYFRHRTVSKSGVSQWDAPVEILVL